MPGAYEGEAFLDDDGTGREDIRIHARVTVAGDRLEIDLTGSDEASQRFVNSSHANTQSGFAMALAFLVDPDIPENDGVLRVKAREGTIVRAHGERPSRCARAIRPTRSSRRSSGRWRRPARSAPWPAGGGASASPYVARIRARAARSSGTCPRPGPAAAAPRPASAEVPTGSRTPARCTPPDARRVLCTKEVGILVQPGDVFAIRSGGGGWGPPGRRDPADRARDVAEGLVPGTGHA